MQKGNECIVLFIDPKGTKHTDGYRKIDGYSKILQTKDKKDSKSFTFGGFNVKRLLLKPKHGLADVLDNYKKYWFDNVKVFFFLEEI